MTKAICLSAVLFAACGVDEELTEDHIVDPDQTLDPDEAGDISPDATPLSFSSWRYVTTQAGCQILVRMCKTATRINWEFTNNRDFYRVQTSGNGISTLESNIDYQWSGSKYRTRAGTTFNWFFDSYRNGCGGTGFGLFISQIPSC